MALNVVEKSPSALRPIQTRLKRIDWPRMLLSVLISLALAALAVSGRGGGTQTLSLRQSTADQTDGLQDVVTWDEYSLKINGTRLMVFSGEVHPYRMPVQSLHLDVFQKIKSMGFNAVSFYIFWGIHEPKRGEISFDGFRDLQPFIDAAKEAGIWLIARPGPYINAETTAGGFPGWGTYTPGLWRTSNDTYHAAWTGYLNAVGEIIAKNQVTNGGPIILIQAENEYTNFQAPFTEDFTYEKEVLDAIRAAGVTIPTTHNDASPSGHYTMVNLWGYDSYPNGFDCSHPLVWSPNAVPTNFWQAHEEFAPTKPNAIYEFQGGAFDGWGGSGYDTCAVLTGPNFERLFYKNNFAMSATILNLYMIYGGTNWGGIAHPGVYTSYDYGSAIAETRTLREKYYELKLQANFLAVSPAYLTTRPLNAGAGQGAFTGNSALTTTQTKDAVGNKTSFFVTRQSDASSNNTVQYTISVPTSKGNLTLPVLGGTLSLPGKDSKVLVTDYAVGSHTLLYSTAEIMTWATIDGRDVLVVYGDAGETHETAILFNGKTVPSAKVVSGSSGSIRTADKDGALIMHFSTNGQTVVEVGNDMLVYVVDRANAYQFWVLHPTASGDFGTYSTANPVIVKGGYLVRSVATNGGGLAITGDLNATATFEIIAPAQSTSSVTFNGAKLSVSKTSYGTITATKKAELPAVTIPNLETDVVWRTANSLPEISSGYSDALWPVANHSNTTNPTRPSTPVVLYAGDYGFHTGNILFRGHVNTSGTETGLSLTLQGGAAFGFAAWLDDVHLGGWAGAGPVSEQTANLSLTGVKAGRHVLTVLQDHMGYEEDFVAASDSFKAPRGILAYAFQGGSGTDIAEWKVTGNLGGEDYADKTRGPLNEGGLFGERQGWHLPGFDDSRWSVAAPTTGISSPGVSFYRTTFALDVPSGVDYPIGIVVSNSTTNPHFRSQFYVNGYQFGKYVNHIGPQTVFPVPQGILNYNGNNTLAISLWAHDDGGAKINSIGLQVLAKAESSMATISNQPAPAWAARSGAY